MNIDDDDDIRAWMRANADPPLRTDKPKVAPHIAVVELLREASRERRGVTLRGSQVTALVAYLDGLTTHIEDQRAERSAEQAIAVDTRGFRESLLRDRSVSSEWSPHRTDEF